MKRGDAYLAIGFTPKRSSCEDKILYLSEEDAETAAFEHERRVVFSKMIPYWCRGHWGWHIGHRDKRRRAALALMKDVEWFALWEWRN